MVWQGMESLFQRIHRACREMWISILIISAGFLVLSIVVIINAMESTAREVEDERWTSLPVRAVSLKDHHIGNLDAPVRLIVYVDLECPYCKIFHQEVVPRLQKKFGDDLAIIYRHYPLTHIHRTAQKAAEAAECTALVRGEEAFWRFVEVFFSATDEHRVPSTVEYPSLVRLSGVDPTAFNRCITDERSLHLVQEDMFDGGLAGITVTPSEIVEGGNQRILMTGVRRPEIEAAVQLLLEKREIKPTAD